MAQKRQKSAYATSEALKALLQAKGLYPQMGPDQSYYDGSQNDIHFTHSQINDGSFATLNITPSSVDTDFIDPSDPALVRRWTVRELEDVIRYIPGVQNYQIQQQGQQWRYFIIYNGVTYEATNANRADACALAFTAMLNAV